MSRRIKTLFTFARRPWSPFLDFVKADLDHGIGKYHLGIWVECSQKTIGMCIWLCSVEKRAEQSSLGNDWALMCRRSRDPVNVAIDRYVVSPFDLAFPVRAQYLRLRFLELLALFRSRV